MPLVTCVVGDDIMGFTLDAAREIGVPCALFWTASTCGYMGYRYYRTLIDKGIFSHSRTGTPHATECTGKYSRFFFFF